MAKQEDRVELKGSARAALPGGQDVGPADPNQQIEVSVLLRRGSKPGEFPSAAATGAQLPRQRKYLSREDFAQVHGASAADVEKIRKFAAKIFPRFSHFSPDFPHFSSGFPHLFCLRRGSFS